MTATALQIIKGGVRRLRRNGQQVQHRLFTARARLWKRPVRLGIGGTLLFLTGRGATAEGVWRRDRALLHRVRFFCRVIRPGMTVLDMGADAGIFSLVAACWAEAGCVIAAEPAPEAFALLAQNVLLNRQGNIIPVAAWPEGTLQEIASENQTAPPSVVRISLADKDGVLVRRNQPWLASEDAPLLFYDVPQENYEREHFHPVETMWLLRDCGYEIYSLNIKSGAVCPRRPGHDKEPIIAVKPGHPSYAAFQLPDL